MFTDDATGRFDEFADDPKCQGTWLPSHVPLILLAGDFTMTYG